MSKKITNLKNRESLPTIKLEPVDRLTLIKYAGASGDFNPIHTIDEEAEKAGLPGIIAHGMWTMGNLSKLLTPFYNEGFIEKYQIRFSGMVFLQDVLTLEAEVKDATETNITFDVQAKNQKEKAVIKGNVTFKLHQS